MTSAFAVMAAPLENIDAAMQLDWDPVLKRACCTSSQCTRGWQGVSFVRSETMSFHADSVSRDRSAAKQWLYLLQLVHVDSY